MPISLGIYGPLRTRPSVIGLSADGARLLAGDTRAHPTQGSRGHPFGRLQWIRWGSSQASARGAVWVDNCRPSCATGVYRARRASVQVFNPRAGVYRNMSITTGSTTALFKAIFNGGVGGGWGWLSLS